jgi:hypothetical protein
MKASELSAKSADELNKELLDLLKAQFSPAHAACHAAAGQYQPDRQGSSRHRARAHPLREKAVSNERTS